MHSFVAEGDIVAMPGFLRPGAFAKTFANGNFTSMRARTGFTHEEGLAELDLDFRADFAGHYHQDFAWKPDGTDGHALMVAASTALRYADLWLFDRRDQFAIGPHSRALHPALVRVARRVVPFVGEGFFRLCKHPFPRLSGVDVRKRP